ncbi:signal peptidase II [Planococcus sp. APC 4015]|nr:signal peptidase II [Planococcus sp. APC 4015]
MSRDQARRFALACVAAAVVVVVDQASKAAALSALSEQERIPLLGDLLGLQLAFNPGALLSLGAGATWLLTLLGVAMTAVLVVATTRARTTGWAVGIGLILGGALGNLIDRLFAPPAFGRGHVTDFLAYGNWFIGNLADVALGAGAIVLAGSLWHRHRRATATAEHPVAGTTLEAGR